jgi:hypothetical protein
MHFYNAIIYCKEVKHLVLIHILLYALMVLVNTKISAFSASF